MALLDIFKMKKLGGTVLLKDNSFLYISKVTGTQFEPEGKDMRILYEDGNGVKKEFMISQVKEARPVEEQPHPLDAPFSIGKQPPLEAPFSDGKQPPLEAPFSIGKQPVFTLLNNMNKLKECEGYFITNDGNRIQVYRVLEFNDMKVTWVENDGSYQRTTDFRRIKEAHITSPNPMDVRTEIDDKYKLSRQTSKINLDYVPPETLDKNLDYQTLDYEELIPSHLPYLTKCPFTNDLGSFKKRKVVEVPLMDDDLEEVLNRTKEINYKLIEDLIDVGVEKFEFASRTVPNDVYQILIMSKGKKKWVAVLQNDNEDVFILDMNSLFIVTAVPTIPTIPTVNKKLPIYDKTEKVETDNLPLCKTLIDRRTFYSHSMFSKEINTMVGLSKALVADGEVMYNFYMKKSLKETMIEKLLKDNLKNDFNILSDELRKGNHEILIYRDNILVKLIFNFEENSNIYCETYSSVDANVEFETKPLPSHLTRYFEDIPQTPRKEKVVEVPQAPRKKLNCSTTRSSTVSKKLDFEEPLQAVVDIPTDRIVTFIYKGDEKRVLVKEANDKYTEGICQTDNKYKKYLTRYIEKVNKVDPLDQDTSSEDEDISSEEPQSIPTYKNMILNSIRTCYVNGTRGLSRQALQAYIMGNYNIKIAYFHKNLRNTLKRLVDTNCIVQTKQSFKLGDEGRKYLKKFTLKELKPVKVNSTQKTKDDKPTHSKQGLSKHDLIQYAIENEKILDIMYDGGSIPDIKRPIRPLKIFKTAYSKKEILQATCLIDDNIKNFTLDKVTVITFIEE